MHLRPLKSRFEFGKQKGRQIEIYAGRAARYLSILIIKQHGLWLGSSFIFLVDIQSKLHLANQPLAARLALGAGDTPRIPDFPLLFMA